MIPAAVRPALATLLALASLTGASTALADGPPPAVDPEPQMRLPVAFAARPITLPSFVLSPEVGVDWVRQDASASYADLTVQVAFGITDDLTIRALVAPLQLAAPAVDGGFHYGQTAETRGPSAGATYRFVRGAVEAGVGLDVRVFTATDITGVAIIPAASLRGHVGKRVRLDVAASVNITRATSTEDDDAPTGGVAGPVHGPSEPANAVRLSVPATALVDIVEPLHLGVSTGLTINNFSDASNETGIPLGFFAGYAIAGRHGPILDIDPYLNFPAFIRPAGTSVTDTGDYVVGVNLVGYLYL